MSIVGARPSELREELVNRNCRKEPVHLKCSEGPVNVNSRKEPGCLICSEGLVSVNSKSSSIWVEGRGR